MPAETQIYEDLRRNLIALRDEHGYSQSQLARAMNIPQSTYAGYELGLRRVPLSVLKQLAGFFSVTIDDLLKEGLKEG